jgi:cephalosporin hydroxylase
MKITIDTDTQTLETDGGEGPVPLYSDNAFEILSDIWLKVGWNQKYVYTFSWFGRPFIQLPEDVLRAQEVIYRVKPTVIVETGVAHGGGLVFYASLMKGMGIDAGRVIGVDVEIRPHNREAIESHELASMIQLVEGSSTDPEIVKQVTAEISPEDTVLIFLDSNHSKAHVAAELEAYHSLVTAGSYIVATDGSMRDLDDVPRGDPEWTWDNPAAAAEEFAEEHAEFVLEQPAWTFNESTLSKNLTHWPSAYLRRKS